MDVASHIDQNPERPLSVTYAVVLIVYSIAAGMLIYAVQAFAARETWSISSSPAVIAAVLVLAIAVSMLLLYFTAQIANGRNWARWLFFVGYVVTLCEAISGLGTTAGDRTIVSVLAISQILAQTLAAALLLQDPSSSWFKTNRERRRRMQGKA